MASAQTSAARKPAVVSDRRRAAQSGGQTTAAACLLSPGQRGAGGRPGRRDPAGCCGSRGSQFPQCALGTGCRHPRPGECKQGGCLGDQAVGPGDRPGCCHSTVRAWGTRPAWTGRAPTCPAGDGRVRVPCVSRPRPAAVPAAHHQEAHAPGLAGGSPTGCHPHRPPMRSTPAGTEGALSRRPGGWRAKARPAALHAQSATGLRGPSPRPDAWQPRPRAPVPLLRATGCGPLQRAPLGPP